MRSSFLFSIPFINISAHTKFFICSSWAEASAILSLCTAILPNLLLTLSITVLHCTCRISVKSTSIRFQQELLRGEVLDFTTTKLF